MPRDSTETPGIHPWPSAVSRPICLVHNFKWKLAPLVFQLPPIPLPLNRLYLSFYNPSQISSVEVQGLFSISEPPFIFLLPVHVQTMSDPQQKLWSNNLNAPKVTYDLHLREKSNFAGLLIGSILYGMSKTPSPTFPFVRAHFVWFILGMLIKLFFKCITSLINPVHRRGERIKWGLAFYIIAMFSIVTVFTAANLALQSISYIDNREYSGVNGMSLSGPCGYRKFIYSGAGGVILHLMFLLNGWLADGLLVGSLFDTTFTHQGSNPGSSRSSIVVT